MIKGIYTSALGLIPLQKKLEVIANNLANVDTTAFKRDDSFANELIAANTLVNNGSVSPTQNDVSEQTLTDFSQGPLQQTSNPLDVAIDGPGFFVVQNPDGSTSLTRDGSFTLSSDGTLVTRSGAAVMGAEGPIRISNIQQIQSNSLVIDRYGVVKAGKEIYGQLRVVMPSSYSEIAKAGGNLYSINQGAQLRDVNPSSVTIRQGYLEGSNVNPIEEMVAMIQIQQDFEAGQKAIQSQDSTLSEANQVGQVP